MTNEHIIGRKLEVYTKKLLLSKGVEFRDGEYVSLMRKIGETSANLLFSSEAFSSEAHGFSELFRRGMIIVYGDFLKKKGWSEEEINEFFKKVKLKYIQLQTETFPFII